MAKKPKSANPAATDFCLNDQLNTDDFPSYFLSNWEQSIRPIWKHRPLTCAQKCVDLSAPKTLASDQRRHRFLKAEIVVHNKAFQGLYFLKHGRYEV